MNQGKDEGLFHAAIMESGGPVGAPMQPLSWYAGFVESLAQTVGCYKEATSKDPADVIKCFRKIPTETWIATRTTSLVWNPSKSFFCYTVQVETITQSTLSGGW